MNPQKQDMMKQMMNAATPGLPHKIFESFVGNWNYTSKWWDSADGKPQMSSGESQIKMILGGRFIQHNTHGKSMGMPFNGMGLTGYNNLTAKYETLWLDTMSTGMMRGEGTFDESTQTLTDSGEFSCPLSVNHKATYRAEWKKIDSTHMVYSMYGHGIDGKAAEFKEMELSFTKR